MRIVNWFVAGLKSDGEPFFNFLLSKVAESDVTRNGQVAFVGEVYPESGGKAKRTAQEIVFGVSGV